MIKGIVFLAFNQTNPRRSGNTGEKVENENWISMQERGETTAFDTFEGLFSTAKEAIKNERCEKMKKITMDIPAELLEKLDDLAEKADRSRSQQIRYILACLLGEKDEN